MKVATGSRLTTAGGGVDGGTLGAVGGAQTQTLLTANLPPYTPAGSVSVTSTGGATVVQSSGPTDNFASIAGAAVQTNQTRSAITSTGSLTGTAQGGTSTPFRTMQPTIVCNYIVRII
jgi:microcystin-dependent protein